jgi:putative heme iron utilization protein
MEGILGRSLQEDEVVSITTYKLAPRGRAREEASTRLLERIDKTAKRVEGESEKQIDAAIDEAADYVRHHRE